MAAADFRNRLTLLYGGALAVVRVQADQWVARGTLAGLRQNNDKAELQALTSLVRWLYGVIAPMLQLDSINFYKIRMTFQKMPKMDCGSRCQLSLLAQHIAAHQLGWIEEDPVDAWPAEWNDGADQEAGAAHFYEVPCSWLAGKDS